jgi:hypothetical protein
MLLALIHSGIIQMPRPELKKLKKKEILPLLEAKIPTELKCSYGAQVFILILVFLHL